MSKIFEPCYIRRFLLLSAVVLHTAIPSRSLKLSSKGCPEAPKECPNADVNFYLFTKQSPDTPIKLSVSDVAALSRAPFTKGAVKFLIHGYTGSIQSSPTSELKPAYFEADQDVNIISVDYSKLVQKGCYRKGIQNTGPVAMCVAQFLDTLLDTRTDIITLPQIHIIGFSLGCHVAAQIKDYFKHGKILRITGLDAALPFLYYIDHPPEKVLSRGDAIFVDTLHTNAGISGFVLQYGNIDFYANGGSFQPGCDKTDPACSHIRACELYAASINRQNEFWAHRCNLAAHLLGNCDDDTNTWEKFGEYVNQQAQPGTYFFHTLDKPPFALPKPPEVPDGSTRSFSFF